MQLVSMLTLPIRFKCKIWTLYAEIQHFQQIFSIGGLNPDPCMNHMNSPNSSLNSFWLWIFSYYLHLLVIAWSDQGDVVKICMILIVINWHDNDQIWRSFWENNVEEHNIFIYTYMVLSISCIKGNDYERPKYHPKISVVKISTQCL